MPRKNKTRRLWLEVKFKVPKGISRESVIRTLIESVEHGHYKYPKGWLVGIYWSNHPTHDFKSGEFGKEMRASRNSSGGWDDAVLTYLRGKL